MPATDESYSIEISEVYGEEQEDLVIEKVKGLLKKEKQELKSYFKETDSLEIKKLSRAQAQKLIKELESIDVKVEMKRGKQKQKKEKQEEIRCPKCGFRLEFEDWRCPECFYEFPDYEYLDEDTSQDEKS